MRRRQECYENFGNKKGSTLIEYSLMVAFIASVAFIAVKIFGSNLNAGFAIMSGLFP